MKLGVWVPMLIASAVLLVCVHAEAQVPETEQEAQRFFVEGVEKTKAGLWGDALLLFERSRNLVERPSTIFNLAAVYVHLGRPADAVRTLREFLAVTNDAEDGPQRAEAQQMLTRAMVDVSSLRVRVTPDHAFIRVNGRGVEGSGAERVLLLNPGSSAIEIRADGFVTYDLALELGKGQVVEQEVVLSELEAAAESKPASPAPPAACDTEVTDVGLFASPWFWLASSAVLFGIGVAVGALAFGQESANTNQSASALRLSF